MLITKNMTLSDKPEKTKISRNILAAMLPGFAYAQMINLAPLFVKAKLTEN